MSARVMVDLKQFCKTVIQSNIYWKVNMQTEHNKIIGKLPSVYMVSHPSDFR